MAIFKCKMCGGSLDISDGVSVATCEYCGTKQTVPKLRDEVVSNLFNRANNLRLKCEFDKAEQVYEKILDIDNADPEAHWGVVLCKYGIEYVEDTETYSRIPTCHRTLYEAVSTDINYLSAIENADSEQKELYIAEAEIIDELQKNILNIANSEEPFDVFICYKETDENGKRTIDSAITNDIYYQLTQAGFKVFYAPITLEDKLGHEYEPYVFAALNSAKVMLVVGTKHEYFDSVWVRNEWSRFFKSMKNDRSKLLIPCYRDMDVYELPDEFAHLQAQDIGKIGFISDIIRGLKKVFNRNEQTRTVAVKKKPKKTRVNAFKKLIRIIKSNKKIMRIISLIIAFLLVLEATNLIILQCYRAEKLKTVKIGGYVKVGSYEQDGDSSNGEEDIEWLVLDIKNGKLLVISRYGLECKEYNSNQQDSTWESCSLRKWLNNDFLENALSFNERRRVRAVTVSADYNPKYNLDPGHSTRDKVFVLSINEAKKYFNSNNDRCCKPTKQAIANGTQIFEDSNNCSYWWLRTPGNSKGYVANVYYDGGIHYNGGMATLDTIAVRPAMWIDASAVQ